MNESHRGFLRSTAVLLTVPGLVFWPIYALVVAPWIVPADSIGSSMVQSGELAAWLGLGMFGVCVWICFFATQVFKYQMDMWVFVAVPLLIIGLAAIFTTSTHLPSINLFRIPALCVSGVALMLIALFPKRPQLADR